MEELIELLNEYSEKRSYNGIEAWVEHTKGNLYWRYWENSWSYMVVISKEYGFIKWLVDNNKIDLKEFHRLCGIINQDSEYWNGTPQDYEQVIMYLSISDYPIEDLVSILK